MTLPFFGSGLVELPPGGEKRAKNCRKMQMCFFVHEGKVMVEVFAAGEGTENNQFAISKGGVWVVPRGEFASYFLLFCAFPFIQSEVAPRPHPRLPRLCAPATLPLALSGNDDP